MSQIDQQNHVLTSIRHQVGIDDFLFCPDGSCLVMLEDVYQDRPRIFLLDLKKENPWENRTLLYEGYKDEFRGLNISPDGKWLVSQYASFFVYLWDLRQPQKEPYELAGHEGRVNSTLFSPDERLLLTASDDRVMRFWRLDLPNPSIQSIKLVGHDTELANAEFSTDGNWLLTSGYDHTLRIWDAQKITEPHVLNQDVFGTELFRGHNDWITGLSFSPDNRYLLSSSHDGKVKKWSVSDNNLFGQSETILEIDEKVFEVEYSKNGNWIASAGEDGIVYLMKASENSDFSETFYLAGHEAPVHVIEFSPDSRWLASGAADGSLIIWDLSVGKPAFKESYYSCCLSTLATGYGISDLQFSPDNKWLASSDSYELTALWDMDHLTRPLKPTKLLRGHIDAPVLDLEFSSDGRLLATGGGDYRVALWDLLNIDKGYLPLTTYSGGVTDLGGLGFSGITGVKFSPDGRWLISITGEAIRYQGESIVTLWDLSNLTSSPIILRGHEGNVISMAISPNGEWLVTGDLNPERNGTALVWNLNYLKSPAIVLDDHFGRVNQIAISTNNEWLATADIDIHLWSLDGNETIKIACELAGRNLTLFEWQQYFPSEIYRSTCPQYPAAE
jgi:WD40 repeat protein